jgi:hypothetical protein
VDVFYGEKKKEKSEKFNIIAHFTKKTGTGNGNEFGTNDTIRLPFKFVISVRF